MPVVYSDATKAARMQAVLDAIDAAVPNARLRVYDTGFATLLLDFLLAKPSFSRTDYTLTLLGVPLFASGLANAQAALARILDGNGVIIVDQLSVGETQGNIIIESATITVGQPNRLQSGLIVHG